MKVQLHRLSRDVVCIAEVPHTNPVPGVIMHGGRAYVLGEVPYRFNPLWDVLHYQETFVYDLPPQDARSLGDAGARAEANL